VGLTIIQTLLFALDIYTWILIAAIVVSWLYAFQVINTSNRFVGMVAEFLHKATEPLLRPIRRYMPDLGGIDISPIVLFVGIFFLQRFIVNVVAPAIV